MGEAPEAATLVDAGAHQQLFNEEPLNFPIFDIKNIRVTKNLFNAFNSGYSRTQSFFDSIATRLKGFEFDHDAL